MEAWTRDNTGWGERKEMKLFFKINRLLLVLFTMFLMVSPAVAQFDDDNGPGGFGDPGGSDVPLDSYQWLMLVVVVGYGLFMIRKHRSPAAELVTDPERNK